MTRFLLIYVYNSSIEKPQVFKTHKEAHDKMMQELSSAVGCYIDDPDVWVSWTDFEARARRIGGHELLWAIYEIEV